MRPGHPAQQVEDRQRDRDEHAVEDAEQQHADGRGEREDELAAPEAGDPPELGDVDQPDRGVDDERAERGRREGGEHRPSEQQRDERPIARATSE